MNPRVGNLLRSSVIAFTISQLFCTGAWAASDAERIAELEKKLESSLLRIERLSTRLGELEQARAPAGVSAPAPAAVAVQESRIETLERSLAQIAESNGRVTPGSAGVPVHGFTDVVYASSNKPVADGRKRGFALGNVDFYLTPEFGDRIKTLVELVFEYGDEGDLATDLERLQIGYTFSDALTVWAGRFHTPYGYWNTAFHHGAQIQSSIQRPKFIAFEDQGGILPAHTVGVWATGQTRTGEGRLEYDAYAGNGGRTLDGVLDFNPFKDNDNNMVVGGSVRYRFGGALDGAVLGTHAFSQKVSAYTNGALDSTTRVNMAGAYGFYDGNDWEVISEYYHFRDTDLSGGSGSHTSRAGFLQVGKSVFANTLPYVRVEKTDLDQRDNYFASQNSGRSYSRQVVGVRYDLNPKMAVKFELNRTDETKDGGVKYNEAHVQAAVRF